MERSACSQQVRYQRRQQLTCSATINRYISMAPSHDPRHRARPAPIFPPPHKLLLSGRHPRVSLRVCLADGHTPLQLALLLDIYTPVKHTKLAARARVTSGGKRSGPRRGVHSGEVRRLRDGLLAEMLKSHLGVCI